MFIKAEPIDKAEGKKTEKGLGGASCTLPQPLRMRKLKMPAAACFPSGIFVSAGENFLLYWCPMYILIAEVMVMEERKAKILINRAGGNAGAQSKGYRVALPSAWMKSLGITENDREVLLQFDGECITLRRPGPSGYEAFLREARRQGHDLLRLHYYDGDTLCTKICADKVTRCLAVENLVDDLPVHCLWGEHVPHLGGLGELSGGAVRSPPAGRAAVLLERAGPGSLRSPGHRPQDPGAHGRGQLLAGHCGGMSMAMKLTTGKRIAETSSKGNQEKWREGGRWYKLDLFGYEGLAETVASRLLEHTNLGELGFSFVPYRMEQLEVHRSQANRLLQPGLSPGRRGHPHPGGAVPQRGGAGLASPSLPPAQPCQPGAVDGGHHPAAHRP